LQIICLSKQENHWARANNNLNVENWNRRRASNFFPEISGEEIEEADIDGVAVEDIVSN
jgi:hypothetical protein